MSYLFKITDSVVYPNEETLLIEPFKTIWERDDSPKKEVALKEFTYIEFISSQLKSNPYRGYRESARDSILKKNIIQDENWIPDILINEAIEKIEEFQKNGSASYSLYKKAIAAKEKLEDFFDDFDLNDKTDKGTYLLKPKDITGALLDLDKVIVNLESLKEKIEKELFEEVRNKSDKTISPFAEGSSLEKYKI